MNLRERFDAKWEAVTETGCWLWTATKTSDGYGLISLGGKKEGTIMAHRLAWQLFRGPIPNGKCVLHKCDTPPCVNPEHLFLGTNADNTADMMAKGRHKSPCGEKNGQAKLSADAVFAIRKDTRTQSVIAAEHGVTAALICMIRNKKRWSSLPLEAQ